MCFSVICVISLLWLRWPEYGLNINLKVSVSFQLDEQQQQPNKKFFYYADLMTELAIHVPALNLKKV